MRDIKGYEGLYAVTSCGRVWSYRSKKFLKPGYDGKGYLHVSMCKNGEKKTLKIHRLVAETYIPNPDNLETIDHIDNNKQNNCINNLRWMTAMDNLDRSSKARIKIICTDTGEIFNSLQECERKTGCPNSNISAHLRGKREHVKGLHFIKI